MFPRGDHPTPPTPSPQCIGHITGLMLQGPAGLQQPALKLMAESGDGELLRQTLDQIGSMTAVSVFCDPGQGGGGVCGVARPGCGCVFERFIIDGGV